MIVAQVHTIAESTRAWNNFISHCETIRVHLITRDTVPIKLINEELAKYGAEYDPVHCDIIFAEEKNYMMWLLKWG